MIVSPYMSPLSRGRMSKKEGNKETKDPPKITSGDAQLNVNHWDRRLSQEIAGGGSRQFSNIRLTTTKIVDVVDVFQEDVDDEGEKKGGG